MKERTAEILRRMAGWLRTLSFRTGVAVAAACAACYALSFAQMLLPISMAAKSVLWVIFFGMAKALQYSALLILGKAGWTRIKLFWTKS